MPHAIKFNLKILEIFHPSKILGYTLAFDYLASHYVATMKVFHYELFALYGIMYTSIYGKSNAQNTTHIKHHTVQKVLFRHIQYSF